MLNDPSRPASTGCRSLMCRWGGGPAVNGATSVNRILRLPTVACLPARVGALQRAGNRNGVRLGGSRTSGGNQCPELFAGRSGRHCQRASACVAQPHPVAARKAPLHAGGNAPGPIARPRGAHQAAPGIEKRRTCRAVRGAAGRLHHRALDAVLVKKMETPELSVCRSHPIS